MGACYSTASNYTAWLCGYGAKPLDGLTYTDMNGDPINIDDFLSDDELLGLDDNELLISRKPRASNKRNVLSWRLQQQVSSPENSTDVASPYGHRPLIVHNDHFDQSQLSDGMDTGSEAGYSPEHAVTDGVAYDASSTSSSNGGGSGDCAVQPARTRGSAQCVSSGAASRSLRSTPGQAQLAASRTADVMLATHRAMRTLYTPDTATTHTTHGNSTSTDGATTAAEDAANDYVIGNVTRHHPAASSIPLRSGGRPQHAMPEDAISLSSSSSLISRSGHGSAAAVPSPPIGKTHELTSWIDNPDELRAMNYESSSASAAPEDFEEFLNSVVARSLTGQYDYAGAVSPTAMTTAAAAATGNTSSSSDVNALAGSVIGTATSLGNTEAAYFSGDVSDADDYGLVVGESGQIMPANYQQQHHQHDVNQRADYLARLVDDTHVDDTHGSGSSTPDIAVATDS
eukprot:scpid75437/ scgid12182/ 